VPLLKIINAFIFRLISFFPIHTAGKIYLNRIRRQMAGYMLKIPSCMPYKKIVTPSRNKLFVITFWQFLASALTFYFAYLAFDFRITFLDSFFATILSLYSSVIRLVPASLACAHEALVTLLGMIRFA